MILDIWILAFTNVTQSFSPLIYGSCYGKKQGSVSYRTNRENEVRKFIVTLRLIRHAGKETHWLFFNLTSRSGPCSRIRNSKIQITSRKLTGRHDKYSCNMFPIGPRMDRFLTDCCLLVIESKDHFFYYYYHQRRRKTEGIKLLKIALIWWL